MLIFFTILKNVFASFSFMGGVCFFVTFLINCIISDFD